MTTPVDTLDEDIVGYVIERLAETMDQLSGELGIAVRMCKANCTLFNGEVTIQMAVVSNRGVVMDRDAVAYVLEAPKFGLVPEDLGKEFTCSGGRFKVVGLRPRIKHSVLCLQIEPPIGDIVRFQPEQVAGFLAETNRPSTAPTLRLVREKAEGAD